MLMSRRCVHPLLYIDWHLRIISNWAHGSLLNKGWWYSDIFELCGSRCRHRTRGVLVYILNLTTWRSEFRGGW